MAMRVAVDARAVYNPTRRGTGKNLIDLYRRLARLRPHWDFVMFHQRDAVGDPFAGEPNIRHQQVDIKGDRWDLWQQVRLPLAAKAAGAVVLHCPANTAPRLPLVPLVVTIHDLIPLDKEFGSRAAHAWEHAVGSSARRARRILTPSSFSKAAIVQQWRIPDEKVTVNYWAPDEGCRRVTDRHALDRVRIKHGLSPDEPYVLAFGAADPRKNTSRVIEAWAGLGPDLRSRSRLLVVGLEGSALQKFRELALTRCPDRSCAIGGFADEEDVAALLSGATVLCYPSLSEGFGLPVVDAFACETPVITSATTSLPEIAGDATLLVEPRNTDAIRDALALLLVNPDVRDELRARGRKRLKAFSWDRCARTAADVFDKAAA